MKIRLIVRLVLIALAALLQPAFASEDAEISAEAAELFQQAVAAHGGEALEQVAGYLDEGVVRSPDPMGEAFQERPFRTFVDYVNGRVRTDLLQGDELFRVQQVSPDGAYSGSAMAGELSVAAEEGTGLRVYVSNGIRRL